jgi:hypothetical protein
MANNALDAVQMFQTTTAFRNQAAMGIGDQKNLDKLAEKIKNLEAVKSKKEEELKSKNVWTYNHHTGQQYPPHPGELDRINREIKEVTESLQNLKSEKQNLENKILDKSTISEAFIPTFHIFKDTGMAKDPNDGVGKDTKVPGGYFGSEEVIKSIQSFIGAGAFIDGGNLTGHSAGAFNIGRAIEKYRDDNKGKADKLNLLSKLNVMTFGGVHDRIPSKSVASWTDFYNSNDKARLEWDSTFNKEYDKDGNGNHTENYGEIYDINDKENDKWDNLKEDWPINHNFLTEYSDGFRKYNRKQMVGEKLK